MFASVGELAAIAEDLTVHAVGHISAVPPVISLHFA
jgi:hypothetical protein